MKKSFSFINLGLVALILSMCVTSCSEDYGNGLNLPQPKTDTTNPDKPQPTDSTDDNWSNYMKTWHKVFEDSFVETHMIGQKGGKNVQKANFDTLHIRYKYEYSLLADTTLYLNEAPEVALGYTSASHGDYNTDGGRNAQGDSILSVNFAKNYTLTNGVILNLSTKRLSAWHEMDGILRPYSEPKESIGQISFSPSTEEFERNDSIFGLRTNIVTVPLTLGDKKFYASCTVREVWFLRLKETPEPSFDYKVDGLLKFVCGCKVKNNIGWADGIMFEGKDNIYFVIDNYNQSGKAMGRELHTTPKNRVVFNSQVNGIVYDSTTGLYAPALIVSDKSGWNCEGFVDGRSVICDRSNAQAIDEGIKCFVDKDTSVPSVFFASTPSTSVKEWHGKKYITVNWSKYSPDTDLVTRTVTVAEK